MMGQQGFEREQAAKEINDQIAAELIAEDQREKSEADLANNANRAETNAQTIVNLQAQLDALRTQTTEDDVRIHSLKSRIELLKKNIN